MDTIRSTPELIEEAQAAWSRMYKRPNPVYLRALTEDTEVETTDGTLTGHRGDYLACDPISGHVWPVKASYVEQHYQAPPPGAKKAWLSWS